MNVLPVAQDTQKWINYYKATMGKTSRPIQRGSGGTLGPKTKGRQAFDVVSNAVVAPTIQAVEQAKSEIKHRRGYKSLGNNMCANSRTLTIKRTRSRSSGKPKSKKRKTTKPRKPKNKRKKKAKSEASKKKKKNRSHKYRDIFV